MSNTDPWRFVIRVVKDAAGEPWFVAADICFALDVGNTSMAMSRLDGDEKGISSIDTPGRISGSLDGRQYGHCSLILMRPR